MPLTTSRSTDECLCHAIAEGIADCRLIWPPRADGRERLASSLPAKGPSSLLLEIGVMMPVLDFECLNRHAEPAGGLPKISPHLHRPGCCGMAKHMTHHFGAQ